MRTNIFVKHYRFVNLTTTCIQSIFEHTARGDWTLTVLDASKDFPAEWIVETPTRGLCLVRTIPSETDLIASFNAAIRQFPAEFYLCLNNDIIVAPQWLEAMETCLQRNPRIGIVAPLYDQADGGWLHFAAPHPSEPEWKTYLSENLAQPGTYRILPHVDNCAWGFTQTLVERIGLPDERFKGAGWGANLDFCWRARQVGFLVVASDGSFVHHGHRMTYGKLDPDYAVKATAERDRVLREKYGTRPIW